MLRSNFSRTVALSCYPQRTQGWPKCNYFRWILNIRTARIEVIVVKEGMKRSAVRQQYPRATFRTSRRGMPSSASLLPFFHAYPTNAARLQIYIVHTNLYDTRLIVFVLPASYATVTVDNQSYALPAARASLICSLCVCFIRVIFMTTIFARLHRHWTYCFRLCRLLLSTSYDVVFVKD